MILQKIALLTICVLIFIFPFILYARPHGVVLVLDARNASQLPKHFRTTSDPLPPHMNDIGFSDLHMAGGGQFSKLGMERILQRLQTKNLTVFDLRQESHGFLNGNAISWYGGHNSENASKKPAFIERTQRRLLQDVEEKQTVTVYQILSKTSDERINKVKAIEYYVYTTLSEADTMQYHHLNYERFYTQDFHGPSDADVDRFVQRARDLPANNWVYFHCRAGVGRSTSFMAMFDMMHNAKKVSFIEILARQFAIGGKDLSQLPKPGTYKYKSEAKRLAFLKQFYEYTLNNNDNFKTSWTDWVRQSSVIPARF